MKSLKSKNLFEIRIGDVEGLDPAHFQYKIILDTTEQYLSEPSLFEIPNEGLFSFSLLSNNHSLGGFTIPTNTLRKGQFWFPIQTPFAELNSCPTSVQSPKIFLTIKQPNTDSGSTNKETPVLKLIEHELRHKDELINELEKVIQEKNEESSRLQHIVDELAENFSKFQVENKQQTEELFKENLRIKKAADETDIEKLRMGEEILALKRKLEVLERKEAKEKLDRPQLLDLENIQVRLRDSEAKRKELQQVLNSANTQWLDVKVSNNTLAYLEKENKSLINKVKIITGQLAESKPFPPEDENFMKHIHTLSAKLSSSKQKTQSLKVQMESLESENAQYKDIIENFRSEMSKQASENSVLSEQLKSALSKIPHREEKIDQIDKELRQYFKDKQMKNPFVKITEGVYNYGNKRLCFNLKNGMPVVRVGGGYMFIDEFLKMYHMHCKKKEEFPLRSYSLENKVASASKLRPKIEEDSKLNETDSPASKSKQEIKMLKKVPRRVFIP